jgi:hypothetical protein
VLPSDLRQRFVRALRSGNVLTGVLYELTLFAKQTTRRILLRWQHVTRADRSDPAVREAPAANCGVQRIVESSKKKVFVGTLYSGENEYEECLASIRSQTFRDFDHFVFKHLPNKEAHHTLFKSFLDRAGEYDILIKIDADVVLASDTILEKIVDKMRHDAGIDILAVAVHDFFTDMLINAGMATYRNTVMWDYGKETMFVDHAEVRSGREVYDDWELAPAGVHCKNPAPWQAFHYGLHRGLKSIQQTNSSGHWSYLERVWANFLRTGDTRMGLAVLGAELAYAGRLAPSDVDYTNPRMRVVLEAYQSLDRAGLEREIRRLRARNWGVLPGDLRRRLIRSLRSEYVASEISASRPDRVSARGNNT